MTVSKTRPCFLSADRFGLGLVTHQCYVGGGGGGGGSHIKINTIAYDGYS